MLMVLFAIVLLLSSSVATAFVPPVHNLQTRQKIFLCNYANTPSANDGDNNDSTSISVDIPSFIVSPVLSQVYPSLLAHKNKYGNVNIPLGSSDGKRCKTLRRLHFQNKLTEEESNLLTELGFRFHSFEDVYYECDFGEMLSKLLEYHDEFGTFQIPKKYEPDPELGAWVTMLRRLNNANELPKLQIEKLNSIGFEWISTRKCGSTFMKRYREVFAYLSKVVEAGGDVSELLHEDNEQMKWIDSQRKVYENGNLSESRAGYMDDLPGIDWRVISSGHECFCLICVWTTE